MKTSSDFLALPDSKQTRPALRLGRAIHCRVGTGLSALAVAAFLIACASTPRAFAQADAPAAARPASSGEANLRLNFRGVPLDMVLDYLSEAAGFIIIKETEVKGKVDVWSNQPLTRDEAVDLLDTILNKNEYAAIRNGRTLTIVSRDEAKKRRIPVKRGGDAEQIPSTEQMVTQVVPVERANVTALMNNLRPLLGTYAEMTVNESANSLIITATEADIKRMAEIINALDESISSTSSLKVFPLKYADAKELATVIRDLFAPAQQQNNNTGGNRGQLGGFAGGAFPGAANFGGANAGAAAAGGVGGRGGAGGGGRSGSSPLSIRVVAVADERSNSLIVAAPADMMNSIENIVSELNQPVNDITELRVFPLKNANPIEVANLLASLFPDETRSNSGNANQPQFQFNRGGFGGGFGNFGGGGRGGNAANAASQRMKKQGRVLSVPDERTGSIIVSAASELMPQIADMIAQLDSSQARKQKVFVYSLENADPQQTMQILQEMFQRTTTTANRNNANLNSALSTRIQSNNQNISSGMNNNTGFGTGTGFGGGGGGLGGGGQPLR